MDDPPPLTRQTFAALADRILSLPPRLGGTRLVSVDGPAGSGKTTFAARLAAALGTGTPVVHMDDLYAGWTLTGAASRLAAGVLRPLAEGRAGAHHRYDWAAGRFSPDLVPVPAGPVLLIEGCGSATRCLDPWSTLRVWIEAPEALRLARGLARDGVDLAGEWQRWLVTEAAAFAAEDTRRRAHLRVDGAAGGPPAGFVLRT
ncbi:uridine kinase family protein [Blastococcus xanthinilyticus]|uniref:Uridine kinase n=1 Tax=Blastococcus xanthinilyticus TaxID=1564164 RepID=A0A5S5CPF0_9ACTN|nr:uridine kinase [Blastococcus xanthinilyticus]TYP84646.1 uridine kinase [Blastococcus xanthinilyticus]